MLSIGKREVQRILRYHGRLILKSNFPEDSPLFKAMLAGRVSVKTVYSLIRAGVDVSDSHWVGEALKSGRISARSVKGLGSKGLADLKSIYLPAPEQKNVVYAHRDTLLVENHTSDEAFVDITARVSHCIAASGITKGYALLTAAEMCLSRASSADAPAGGTMQEVLAIAEGSLQIAASERVFCQVMRGVDVLELGVLILGEKILPESESAAPIEYPQVGLPIMHDQSLLVE